MKHGLKYKLHIISSNLEPQAFKEYPREVFWGQHYTTVQFTVKHHTAVTLAGSDKPRLVFLTATVRHAKQTQLEAVKFFSV